MAPRRVKRMKSLPETSRKNKSVSSGQAEPEAESDLPIELLELILSQLSLKDNIRASAVCRRWLTVAISVRRSNKNPWLMYFPKSGDLYEFYNPSDRKSYCLKLPALQSCRICYSKDGWLLLFKPTTQCLFFYCPYTQESVDLPRQHQHLVSEVAAFSAPPTSPNCVLFAIKQLQPNIIAVSTCRLGDTLWTTIDYHIQEPLVGSILSQLVFYNGIFCCLSQRGFVGFYNVERRIWAVLPVPRPPQIIAGCNTEQPKFLAEYNEDIYVICACPTSEPSIYKLNKTNCNWDLTEDLGAMTIFANPVNSHITTDLLGNMRNSIYFSKVQYYGRRCAMYSLRNQRYYPRKQGYDWAKQEPVENIWIDAPDDLSVFL